MLTCHHSPALGVPLSVITSAFSALKFAVGAVASVSVKVVLAWLTAMLLPTATIE